MGLIVLTLFQTKYGIPSGPGANLGENFEMGEKFPLSLGWDMSWMALV